MRTIRDPVPFEPMKSLISPVNLGSLWQCGRNICKLKQGEFVSLDSMGLVLVPFLGFSALALFRVVVTNKGIFCCFV